jgi:hypothetical protein
LSGFDAILTMTRTIAGSRQILGVTLIVSGAAGRPVSWPVCTELPALPVSSANPNTIPFIIGHPLNHGTATGMPPPPPWVGPHGAPAAAASANARGAQQCALVLTVVIALHPLSRDSAISAGVALALTAAVIAVSRWGSRSTWRWLLCGLVAVLCLLCGGRRVARQIAPHKWGAIEEFGCAVAPLVLFALVWLLAGADHECDPGTNRARLARRLPLR